MTYAQDRMDARYWQREADLREKLDQAREDYAEDLDRCETECDHYRKALEEILKQGSPVPTDPVAFNMRQLALDALDVLEEG